MTNRALAVDVMTTSAFVSSETRSSYGAASPPCSAARARGSVGAPVHDDQAHAAPDEALRGRLAHVAGAEQHRSPPPEVSEDLLRELDRHRAHAHRAGRDVRLGAHPLRDREGASETTVQQRAHATRRLARAVRALDLPEDLRLADDHRVEARRDAERVLNRLRPPALVQELVDHVGLGALRQIRAERARRGDDVVGRTVQLHAVARAQHHRLSELRLREYAPDLLGDRFRRNGQTLAHVERRGVVGEPDDEDLVAHPAPPVALT